jgi:hypothetical protein
VVVKWLKINVGYKYKAKLHTKKCSAKLYKYSSTSAPAQRLQNGFGSWIQGNTPKIVWQALAI